MYHSHQNNINSNNNDLEELEKELIAQWKLKAGTTEKTAKHKFVELCQSLPTWGVTLWKVEEKVEGKKENNVDVEWEPCLLGFTHEKIVLMDEDTYEVIKEGPLRGISRWTGSDRHIAIDFGNGYGGDEVLVCRTQQGEEISSHLCRCIDILLRRERERKLNKEGGGASDRIAARAMKD
mmetsp:Transcript_40124/g.63464  ORF Transcript_40124/g.63464 Transcript_40124/m.63464 type:complete len:179 (-) Transcript_40124:502-1038(-)|eukprot:CAMPEP_0201541456 /NCGR_PEP_ID=MMETSP0161_2-20130828/71488_1 /ASSEMBLY_ACC=CAM_ASM_000251 /TAXON_ID=180227 /ORGANISM="Neoparamoeba aestuarina, Strain SoJaBio B1-5/56/2" /LENGTH=178 /DNA_ID=CAMNT_0047948997 /DNA_START=163 /DNA_END=699 /DNA_ORIENTATION=-